MEIFMCKSMHSQYFSLIFWWWWFMWRWCVKTLQFFLVKSRSTWVSTSNLTDKSVISTVFDWQWNTHSPLWFQTEMISKFLVDYRNPTLSLYTFWHLKITAMFHLVSTAYTSRDCALYWRKIACENLVGFSTADPNLFKRQQLLPVRDLKLLARDYTVSHHPRWPPQDIIFSRNANAEPATAYCEKCLDNLDQSVKWWRSPQESRWRRRLYRDIAL